MHAITRAGRSRAAQDAQEALMQAWIEAVGGPLDGLVHEAGTGPLPEVISLPAPAHAYGVTAVAYPYRRTDRRTQTGRVAYVPCEAGGGRGR